MLMVVFQPGGMYRLLGFSSNELTCEFCDAESILGSELRVVNDSIANAADYASIIDTEARYGAVRKVYILCTEAKDLNKSSISQNVNCEKIFKLASSHSPFFSMPEKLVAILLKL